MYIEDFITEFKVENESFDSAGLIDEASIYKWVLDALKPFGQNIMVLQDTVVEVKKGSGRLPDNFYSLHLAYKCDNRGFFVNKEDKGVVQSSIMWTERVEDNYRWNSCEPCCVTNEEKVITEKVYMAGKEVNFYYNNPIPLRLGKTMLRNSCYRNCRNKLVKDSPYEIVINGKTLYTNFKEGNVYMQYYGLPTDEEGTPIIPEVGRGELEKYVDYYVHLKFFEKLLKNKDDENISTLFNYYVNRENAQKGLALTDTKFSNLTPKSFKRIQAKNRLDMLEYEINFPTI